MSKGVEQLDRTIRLKSDHRLRHVPLKCAGAVVAPRKACVAIGNSTAIEVNAAYAIASLCKGNEQSACSAGGLKYTADVSLGVNTNTLQQKVDFRARLVSEREIVVLREVVD